MNFIKASGRLEVGLDAINDALNLLNPENEFENSRTKFIVLISDEVSLEGDSYSADTTWLLDFWVINHERFKDTYFVYAVAGKGEGKFTPMLGRIILEKNWMQPWENFILTNRRIITLIFL